MRPADKLVSTESNKRDFENPVETEGAMSNNTTASSKSVEILQVDAANNTSSSTKSVEIVQVEAQASYSEIIESTERQKISDEKDRTDAEGSKCDASIGIISKSITETEESEERNRQVYSFMREHEEERNDSSPHIAGYFVINFIFEYNLYR